jgi:hypothetical protein
MGVGCSFSSLLSEFRPRAWSRLYAMSASANQMLVRRAIDAIWNRGDLDVADELFTADYVDHGGLIVDIVRGPEAVKFNAALFRLAFPDLHVTVDELSTDDETVVVRWTARSRPTEDPESDPVTANQQLLTGTTRSRLADGMITESWTEWDRARVLYALGLAQGVCRCPF